MARPATAKRRKGPSRAAVVRRWLAVAALGFAAYLYYQPLSTYLERRALVAERSAEVRALRAEKRALERRLAAQTSDAALVREARRLAYVQPGERLFIVRGVPEWRRARAAAASTIGGDG